VKHRECLKRTDHDERFFEYLGNHHKPLPEPTGAWGGGVGFTDHIGKPLTAGLWQDITGRLLAHRLLVYGPGFNTMWCVGWGGGTAIVMLDKDELVENVLWFPHQFRAPMEVRKAV
jgi:hypothetical protein